MDEKKSPLVSVIVPVYNRFELAREALQSVIEQSWKNLEVIVVDDGSTDRTPELETCFADDPRIKYIRIDHSGMAGFVRNRGVESAGGSFIAFLDSDDLWNSSKLEKQVDFMEENPDCRIVHTREDWIRNGKRISQSKFRHKRSGNIFPDALEKCIIGPSTVMMEKTLFMETGGFREDLEIAEDYELWLRICDLNQTGYIDEPLITKRAGHEGQLSEKYGQIEIFRIKALKDLVDKHFFSGDNQVLAENELARKCGIYAAGCRKRGKYEEAAEYDNFAGCYSNRRE